MTAVRTKQRALSQDRDKLRLIPPLADGFRAPGNHEVTERARAWALRFRYLRADDVPQCAHGLYLMPSCPDFVCLNRFPQLDHASLWVPESLADSRPFLLCHAYSSEITEQTRTYAAAHGLGLRSDHFDGWYGYGSLPIRMTLSRDWPLWPIEAAAIVMLAIQPISWPGEDEELELLAGADPPDG